MFRNLSNHLGHFNVFRSVDRSFEKIGARARAAANRKGVVQLP